MRRLIWLPLAGALLIGGAAVTAAAPDVIDDVASAVESTVATAPARAGDLLADVLADLVAEGVINQEQSDAITSELATRVEARRAELQAQREEMRALAEQVRGFLADQVITADEVAQLPDGEIKTALEAMLADGDITVERLRELGAPFFGLGRFGPGGPGPHFRGGPPGWLTPDPAETETEIESDSDS